MKEQRIIRLIILIFWTFFWGLSVIDKIVPDVHPLWVGKDFFALFVKFFGSLGLKDPIVPTIALASISALEVFNFVLYLLAIISFGQKKHQTSEKWFFRAIFSSMILFSLFSIADQVFGDRFQLLEHGLFWMVLIASWVIYKYFSEPNQKSTKLSFSKDIKMALLLGLLLTVGTSYSILSFSEDTFSNAESPVQGKEVIDGIYKFDLPFLADKVVFENTLKDFKSSHPELKVNYYYTGPSELNSKKKTHMLLYIFTERK